MNTRRVDLLFAALLVAPGASPAQAREPTQRHTARLNCGRSTLTAETRWRVSSESPLLWLDQKLKWERAGTHQTTVISLEGRPGRHVAPGQSGLDAVVLSWACITSPRGVNYFLLGYACGSEDTEKFCGGEREWFRLLEEQGRRLDTGFARQDRRYDALHERLGVSAMMAEGVHMTSVSSDD